MYESQISNLESAINRIDELILAQADGVGELITQKIKYQEDLSRLRRLQWEERTQRLDYGDDR